MLGEIKWQGDNLANVIADSGRTIMDSNSKVKSQIQIQIQIQNSNSNSNSNCANSLRPRIVYNIISIND